MAIAALYGSWRRSLRSRLFVGSADEAQARPVRDQSKRRDKRRGAKGNDVREANAQPERRRRRPSRREWNKKRVDSEFDAVIVPSDGVSVSGSDSAHSDWSIGWFEPHSKHFADGDQETFAVLMPCYGSPAPPDGQSRPTSHHRSVPSSHGDHQAVRAL